eukprot:scaffold25374_cov53-Attheya_sp.AAC.1
MPWDRTHDRPNKKWQIEGIAVGFGAMIFATTSSTSLVSSRSVPRPPSYSQTPKPVVLADCAHSYDYCHHSEAVPAKLGRHSHQRNNQSNCWQPHGLCRYEHRYDCLRFVVSHRQSIVHGIESCVPSVARKPWHVRLVSTKE